MPYPNEHACRLKEPSRFQKDSIRSVEQVSNGKPFRILIGKLKGATSTTIQAIRYPKRYWSEAEARAKCNTRGGRFEAALK